MFFIKTHYTFPNMLWALGYLDPLWALDGFDGTHFLVTLE